MKGKPTRIRWQLTRRTPPRPTRPRHIVPIFLQRPMQHGRLGMTTGICRPSTKCPCCLPIWDHSRIIISRTPTTGPPRRTIQIMRGIRISRPVRRTTTIRTICVGCVAFGSEEAPERAYLEILKDVPDTVSFEHADQLMQGLTTLSPRRLEKLLKKTQNVKVRRLFYWFAERHQYAWLKKLPDPYVLDDLGMGAGNRVLVKGGKLDTKYKITVPEEMWTGTANTTNKSSF